MEWYHWPLLIVILISGWATTFAIVGSVVFTIWGTLTGSLKELTQTSNNNTNHNDYEHHHHIAGLTLARARSLRAMTMHLATTAHHWKTTARLQPPTSDLSDCAGRSRRQRESAGLRARHSDQEDYVRMDHGPANDTITRTIMAKPMIRRHHRAWLSSRFTLDRQERPRCKDDNDDYYVTRETTRAPRTVIDVR